MLLIMNSETLLYIIGSEKRTELQVKETSRDVFVT